MALAAVLLATALSYPIGIALGNPWLLPALNTAPGYLLAVCSGIAAGWLLKAILAPRWGLLLRKYLCL
jgi:hypothetical protein